MRGDVMPPTVRGPAGSDRQIQSVREMKAGKCEVVLSLAVEARRRPGLSQSQRAALLGASVRTLQGWEQGRKQPSGAARTLLTSARTNPKALLAVAGKQRVAAVVPGVCAGRVTGGGDALYCT